MLLLPRSNRPNYYWIPGLYPGNCKLLKVEIITATTLHPTTRPLQKVERIDRITTQQPTPAYQGQRDPLLHTLLPFHSTLYLYIHHFPLHLSHHPIINTERAHSHRPTAYRVSLSLIPLHSLDFGHHLIWTRPAR